MDTGNKMNKTNCDCEECDKKDKKIEKALRLLKKEGFVGIIFSNKHGWGCNATDTRDKLMLIHIAEEEKEIITIKRQISVSRYFGGTIERINKSDKQEVETKKSDYVG